MKLKPIQECGNGRTGTLHMSFMELVALLGEPNATELDDHFKVEASWGFQDERERKAFIWCYRQPKDTCVSWSCSGNINLLCDLFGVAFERYPLPRWN